MRACKNLRRMTKIMKKFTQNDITRSKQCTQNDITHPAAAQKFIQFVCFPFALLSSIRIRVICVIRGLFRSVRI